MLNPGSPLARLMNGPVRPGVVAWIGVRPARRAPMASLEEGELQPDAGLIGDRWAGRPGGTRQLTLIAAEQLAAIAGHLGLETVAPEQLRRNLVTRGINLGALRDRRVRLGGALIEVTGECHPCSRLEETLGPGGYNAVRGCGGLTARVLEGGLVRLGDQVAREDG